VLTDTPLPFGKEMSNVSILGRIHCEGKVEMKLGSGNIDLPAMERDLLSDWSVKKTFETSLSKRKNSPHFTFYDGPPFANGLPHYGHLLANTIKDTVPRYWTMRGFYVERRFGWDCHGVPVEFEIEKRENIKGRSDILKVGVTKFNEMCRTSVQHYTKEWERTITRLGRWVDWNKQYRTMDPEYMESVWWVVAQLWKKDLLYKDFKVVPYSPRITAVLSNFEANQNYKDVQDPAITVKFRLVSEDAFVLAWTTTPWTLISNVGLCVGPKIDYVKIKDLTTQENYILAKARLDALYKKGKGDGEKTYEVIEEYKGKDLVGKIYNPIFSYYAGIEGAFRILGDDYVSTEDGTGIVHQAPAFGEDDFRVCRNAGIPLVDPVDEEGCFKEEIPEFKGQFVKDADKNIIRTLKEKGLILRHDQLLHSYPFCERTDTPLIYKAIATWYVRVEKIKDKLVENNMKVNWIPEHLREGRMGKWLENARDWAISRNRFWGTPLPIWVCDKNDQHIEVIESREHLKNNSGLYVNDLHIDSIDPIQWDCKKCTGKMKRVPEVLDCWFESGSMPYAQAHYPFSNEEKFKNNFPADFIAEGLDQTRGWFYTLSVLSNALFDKPAFKNVVVNGLVLAADGKKMSKRHKNYTAPEELIEKMGADSVRLYMLNSPILKAGDLCFNDQGVRDTTRAVILPLWNAYSFLATYAQADQWKPSPELATGIAPSSKNELDIWIISRLQTLISSVNREMEHYRLYSVVPRVLDFIEDLTNWYIRLSRKRFWGTQSSTYDDENTAEEVQHSTKKDGEKINADALDAYQTLYYVMVTFTKVLAPFAPFIADRIYKNLTCEIVDSLSGSVAESVHLCDFPLPQENLVQKPLEDQMDLLRRVANLGRSLRAKHKIRTRQVLQSLMVITRKESDSLFVKKGTQILCTELNVKDILFSTQETKYVSINIKPNLKTLGSKLGKDLGRFRSALDLVNKDEHKVSEILLELDHGKSVKIDAFNIEAQDILIERGPKEGRVVATEDNLTVLLDTTLNPELINEGLSREFISKIQSERKKRNLNVSDRINLNVYAQQSFLDTLRQFKEHICNETLCIELNFMDTSRLSEQQDSDKRSDYTIETHHLTIELTLNLQHD
jgi:isoleucyl-tRNA synthetase